MIVFPAEHPHYGLHPPSRPPRLLFHPCDNHFARHDVLHSSRAPLNQIRSGQWDPIESDRHLRFGYSGTPDADG
jgi:hypothetical protein